MMDKNSKKPFFSIIIPTRNRPLSFKQALDSVLSQSFQNFEIIVVNDGSNDEHRTLYNDIESSCSNRVKFLNLIYRPKGHGSSYSRNYGAQIAMGQYLCFLDDDDLWIDKEHLRIAFESINAHTKTIDAYYSQQRAYYADGSENKKTIWLEDLVAFMDKSQLDKYGNTIYNVEQLSKSNGFSHLNCSIIHKKFFDEIGGMDEDIRYESDRDLYLRSIDLSKNYILFSSRIIAKHHIPDSKKRNNVSTVSSDIERFIYQLRMYSKGIAFSKNTIIRKKCMFNYMYILKKITENLYKNKNYKKSLSFSKQALAMRFSIKWFLFSIYLSILSIIKPEKHQTQ